MSSSQPAKIFKKSSICKFFFSYVCNFLVFILIFIATFSLWVESLVRFKQFYQLTNININITQMLHYFFTLLIIVTMQSKYGENIAV